MQHDLGRDNGAHCIYNRIRCPTGKPQRDLVAWMEMTSGQGCALANWQRLAKAQPVYDTQTEALTAAFYKAHPILRCLARVG